MKIRISANTLRFRLQQTEVRYFQQHGKITEVTEFGPSPADQISFSLEISSEPELSVRFGSNTTTIGVPKALAEQWTATNMVGFEGKLDTGKGRIVEVLVEKDFICQDVQSKEESGKSQDSRTT